MTFNEDDTVLETVPDMHLLNRFLFPHDMLSNRISSLSGGERRRLYLLTILMQNPNMLILDEPTNDLDIVTLNILEEYLLEFKGTVIIVSHDRHFLDRLTDHLLVFCGGGKIKDFIGNYTEYRSFLKDFLSEQKAREKESAPRKPESTMTKPQNKTRKLSFKEKRELEQLEMEIPQIEAELKRLEEEMSSGLADFNQIQDNAKKYEALKGELDPKELRWLELSEIPA